MLTVQKRLLGRTNRRVFPLWVRGILHPEEPTSAQVASFFERLLSLGVEVFDITPSHGVWGRHLREHQPPLQVALAAPPHLLLYAPDSTRAVHAVQAHLIEVLCAIGRERCDYYFLNLVHLPSEAQLSGALEALELARQDGQIGTIGLAGYGDPLRTLAIWRTHDAFEVALLPNQPDTLQMLLPEARARRVGVVLDLTEGPPHGLGISPIEPDTEGISALLSDCEAILERVGADALLIAGTIVAR